jgi:hypothetical protein
MIFRFKIVELQQLRLNFTTESQLYRKEQVCLVLVLQYKEKLFSEEERKEKESEKYIILGNTHIVFNDRRGDIKLAQIDAIMQAFNLLADFYSQFISVSD